MTAATPLWSSEDKTPPNLRELCAHTFYPELYSFDLSLNWPLCVDTAKGVLAGQILASSALGWVWKTGMGVVVLGADALVGEGLGPVAVGFW